MKNRGFIKIFIIAFSFFLQNMISFGETREIPNIIIKDNPKKEVYQIDTIKRRTKPAELNLTVTKIKSKEMNMKIDENNKKIIVDIEKITGGDEIVVVENLKDMPNSLTINGRKALNTLGKIQNQNLKYRYYQTRSLNNTDRVEIEYINRPKEIYLGILNSKKELKTIYKSNFSVYALPRNNTVNLKVWLFAEEMDKISNIVFDPSLNSTGNFKLRASGEHSFPENATEVQNYYGAFDMRGKPLEFEYDDDITVEVEGAKNSQGDFYRYRNKYSEFSTNGFNIKARIWSEFSGVELSLEKISKIQDGYKKFTIKQKDRSGNIIQTVNVELFINGKKIGDYFKFGEFIKKDNRPSKFLDRYVEVPVSVTISNFVTDSLILNYPVPHTIHKRIGDTGETKTYTSYKQMYALGEDFGNSKNNKINARITQGYIYIKREWFDEDSYNAKVQFFYSDGIQMTYAAGKRYIPVRTELCLFYQDWSTSTEKIEGTIVGLPILNQPLNNKNINGEVTVKFTGNSEAFKLSKSEKSNSIDIYEGDYNLGGYSSLNGLNIDYKGVRFVLKFWKEDGAEIDRYKHYYFTIANMNLEDKDRRIAISGVDQKGYYETAIKENIIHIPKFDPLIMLNQNNSSVKKNITLYEEVSTDFLRENNGKNLDLGTIYTSSLNKAILRENCSTNPTIEILDNLYLEAQSNVTYKNIPIDIVFNKTNTKKMNIDLVDGTVQNDRLSLQLSEDSYRKFIENGGGVKYLVKSRNQTNICSIYLKADKAPIVDNYVPIRRFRSDIINKIEINTKEINPSVVTLKFLESHPILLDEIKLLKNTASYVNNPSFNNGLQLTGSIQDLNQTQKHNVEVLDASGRKIMKIMDKGGNGGYFPGLSVGSNNTVTLRYKREDKGTYILLEDWNYEKSFGDIVVKHFSGASTIINQYYKIKVNIPQFDPYVYYFKKGNSLEIGSEIVRDFPIDTNKILLGEVAILDCDMTITKKYSGPLKDEKGVRIEASQSVKFKNKDTGKIVSQIGKIQLIYGGGNNTELIGRNKSAKVELILPEGLEDANYEIIPDIKSGTLFKNSNNYLLKIGRNGYWKELINKIELKKVERIISDVTIDYFEVDGQDNLTDSWSVDRYHDFLRMTNNKIIPQLKKPLKMRVRSEAGSLLSGSDVFNEKNFDNLINKEIWIQAKAGISLDEFVRDNKIVDAVDSEGKIVRFHIKFDKIKRKTHMFEGITSNIYVVKTPIFVKGERTEILEMDSELGKTVDGFIGIKDGKNGVFYPTFKKEATFRLPNGEIKNINWDIGSYFMNSFLQKLVLNMDSFVEKSEYPYGYKLDYISGPESIKYYTRKFETDQLERFFLEIKLPKVLFVTGKTTAYNKIKIRYKGPILKGQKIKLFRQINSKSKIVFENNIKDGIDYSKFIEIEGDFPDGMLDRPELPDELKEVKNYSVYPLSLTTDKRDLDFKLDGGHRVNLNIKSIFDSSLESEIIGVKPQVKTNTVTTEITANMNKYFGSNYREVVDIIFDIDYYSAYYDETRTVDTIKANSDITKEWKLGTNEIKLGDVAFKNFEMEVFKVDSNGNKTTGLHIEKTKVKMKNKASNEVYEVPLILRKSTGDVELINSQNEQAEVYLDMSSVPRGDYESINLTGNLKLLGQGYTQSETDIKNLINKITITEEKLPLAEGSATLNVGILYKDNTPIRFESNVYENLKEAKLESPIPEGVTLENTQGKGVLKGEQGDRFYITHNGITTDIGILDSSGSCSPKEITLQNGSKLSLEYKNGKLVTNIVDRKNAQESSDEIGICLERKTQKVLDFKLTVKLEASWIKIINREVLDFGDVIKGSKNLDAKASIQIQTAEGMKLSNMKVSLDNNKVKLHPVSNPTQTELEAEIVYYDLLPDSLKNRYRIDVEGKLYTNDSATLGEHKGTAEFIIEIKE